MREGEKREKEKERGREQKFKYYGQFSPAVPICENTT